MDSILLPLIVSILVFIVIFFALPKILEARKVAKAQRSLGKVKAVTSSEEENKKLGLGQEDDTGGVSAYSRMLIGIPFFGRLSYRLKEAGIKVDVFIYTIIMLVLAIVLGLFYSLMGIGSFGFPGAKLLPIILGFLSMLFISGSFITYRYEKRVDEIINNFPEVIDIIVRSVRSGHPLLSSFKLIAQNTNPPMNLEFQKIVDEIAYGRPLQESLKKMANRMNILEVSFFTVILSVQQETGGNLAEILSNLSGILRKRKQLRQKIRGLTSEGRATGWIFCFIPVVQLIAVKVMAPNYLDPLVDTDAGRLCALAAIVLIVTAIYVSRRMCRIEV